MPIFYNFHILLATFYTIFGTNILIQCPVLVPVCCMFYVSQNIHINRNPNGIKTDGDYFGIFGEYGKKNPRETVPEGGTRQGGAPHPTGRAPDPRGAPVRRLMPFFGRKKANFWRKKSRRRFQSNRSYGSPDIKETVKGQQTRTQKQREAERQIQSRRGSRPSHAMETKDQRGNPSPSREEVKEE